LFEKDIFVGGNFTQAENVSVKNLAIFTPSNSSWQSIENGTEDLVRTLEFASDGTLFVGGLLKKRRKKIFSLIFF